MALPLGEHRDQHVGPGHLLPARRLHMDRRALQHPLEAGGGLGILRMVADQPLQLGLDIVGEVAAQLVDIDIAGAQHRDRILIVGQREQQMLQGGELVMTFVRQGQGAVKALFEVC